MQKIAILCYIDPRDWGPDDVGPMLIFCDLVSLDMPMGKILKIDPLEITDSKTLLYLEQFLGQEIDLEDGVAMIEHNYHPPPIPHEIRYMAFLPSPKPKQ